MDRAVLTVYIGAQTSIVQSLTYFEHLSEPMAEFLHILSEQYDYTQLGDEILRFGLQKKITSNSLLTFFKGTCQQRIQL